MSELGDISAPAPASNPLDEFSAPVSTARQKAVVNSNAVPDEAGRALKIEKQTGIPASVVQTDLPGYDAHAKTQAAIKAIENPAIANYIDKNPMASQVSNDDYEKLDEVSQYFANLHRDQIHGKASVGVFAAVPEIANMLTTAPGRMKLYNALTELPKALLEGLVTPFTVPGKVYSGQLDLTTKEGEEQAIGLGLGLALGSAGRRGTMVTGPAKGLEGITDRGALAGNETALQRESGIKIQTFDDFMANLRGMKTRQEIDDFIASKTAGPPGQMLMIEKAGAAGEALDKAVEVSQDSTTKQRSPDLYEEFLQAHGDHGTVHVPAQAVLDLYQSQGKVPMVGDGLFGFVPGLAEKATLAAETGAEIKIPISKYVAHVDEAVHEKLKDVIRVQEDGVTREEAKEAQKAIEAYHGTPHDFEQFDLTKIGTGEGAQVYGHGLYFAENKQVGIDYKDKVATDESVRLARQRLRSVNGDKEVAISKLQEDRAFIPAESAGELAQIDAAIKHIKDGTTEGQLYKVQIAADPTHFLDWDKPFGEQGPRIQEAVKELHAKYDLPFHPELNKDVVTGEQIYNHLRNIIEGEIIAARESGTSDVKFSQAKEQVSKILAEAGIPGIKYLDQGSRGAGDGTRNFVVFDDKLVKIIEKNDNPIVQAVEAATEAAKVSLGLRPALQNFLTPLFKDAEAVNITAPEFKRYADLIDRAQEQVLTKAVALAKRDAAKRLTPEWQANETRIRGEVEAEIISSPAYLADRYFNFDKGMLPNGKRILHTHFKPMGEVLADEWAPIFGFESGAEMSQAVIARELARQEAGKGPKWQLKQEVDAETARRMETEYGKLDENIALEASEAALAEYNVDLLAAELRMLAKVNRGTPPFSRDYLTSWGKEQFEKLTAGEISYEQWRRASEKMGREAEKALLKKDYAEALIAKQRQMLAFLTAREAKAFEKERARIEGKIERFTKEQVIKSIDQEYLEQIRGMLDAVGVDQRFGPSRPLESIDQFVANSEGQLAVAPWLRGELPEGMRSPPTVNTMTVEQYRDLGKSLQSMEHVGRFAKTISDARGAAELQNVIVDIKGELERFKFIDQPVNPSPIQKARSVGRTIIGAHLLVERMFDYTDKFNPEGPLNRFIDRPLRDSNMKEIQLTEQVTRMLRDLYQYTDKSDLELIPNNLIPDKMAASGFMNMTRQNLRQLMLHTGNRSNFKKLSEGFNLNEADIRRFVDANATASDVAWVNGIWKIFDHLKPEADAMQLRDTGVAADTIPAVPWEIKAGKLNGGYHPIVYDRYNSDIQGHMAAKNPVFDPHYVQATTPHGYTVARTEFKGALDLTGNLLATRIQGMIHDIAFREAVRSTNKLISNQEFRTALAQRWGKEFADLLPGWLKDIANSHTLDDQYAQGLARMMALIRQNVISTLIAFNPSTVIKHGFTAMLMSAERVGPVDLAKATKDLGLNDAWQTAKDLVRRGESVIPDEDYMQAFRDALDQGERGESIRNFVLQSSAVMRARSRQIDDTIRGAIDKMNQLGAKGLFMNLREKNIQYGRFAVAFSDQLSAVPTWYAAYKQAYLKGATHEDAVFQADKEVSRAHGSQFTGDQPRVTRIGNGFQGEVLKLFTPLYKFYNHFANGNFQFVWDANAYLKGNPTGEPGANAARLSLHIGIVLATLFIEEQASAALDKDRKGFLHSMLMKSMHLFGGQFVGLREVTSGLSHGYGPASGLMGTIFKAGEETVKDIGKEVGLKAGIAKNAIKHTADSIGFITGLGGSQLGRTGQFLYNVGRGRDQPQGFNQWRQGLRTGSSKPRVH